MLLTFVIILELLIKIGFSEKEGLIYLALLEMGNQPASVMAKKLNIPRPTALVTLENLCRRGYLTKSKRGRTQYFEANPNLLEKRKNTELSRQNEVMEKLIPLLKSAKNPYSMAPKVQISEGIEGCRGAYMDLLSSKSEVLEFATHLDLEKMGKDFMKEFIAKRVEKKIKMTAICADTNTHIDYQKKDAEQARHTILFNNNIGQLFSSIAIYDNKVLILNLYHDPFAIIIESEQVATTLRTVFNLAIR